MNLKLDCKDNSQYSEKIDEQKVIDITRNLVFAEKSELQEKDLLYEIIKITKCDLFTAESIFEKFKELGLGVCTHYMMPGYSLTSFAEMRDYVTIDEIKQLESDRMKKAKRESQREAKFMEKYGTDRSKWSDDTWEEFEYGD